MAALSSTDRRQMWFGTEQSMRWIPTPQSGAEMGAEGAHSEGTLINGGGFSQHSWGSHRVYDFEWPGSSARQAAQLMKSYRDGTYGRGLIHFIDPLTYDLNILPARWADPSMAVGDEGSTLVYGVDPVGVPTSGREKHDLPVVSAHYNLNNTPVGYRGVEDSLFIPIPPAHQLLLGAFYTTTGDAGVYITEVPFSGPESAPVRIASIGQDNPFVTNTSIAGLKGIRLWVGRMSSAAASVTLTAMTARITRPSRTNAGVVLGYGEGPYGEGPYGGALSAAAEIDMRGPWVGGMGHSGCRFSAVPAYVANTGVNGGQVGYAATLREVGSWLYG